MSAAERTRRTRYNHIEQVGSDHKQRTQRQRASCKSSEVEDAHQAAERR